jgi:hypothetical protein
MKKERSLIYKEAWRDNCSVAMIVELIIANTNTDIIIDNSKEGGLFNINREQTGVNRILRLVDNLNAAKKIKTNNNNTVTIILGNYTDYSLDNVADDINWHSPQPIPQTPNYETAIRCGLIDHVHSWPTFFLAWNGYKVFRIFENLEKAIPDPVKEKLFILKVRQAKPHRILLLDELAKRGLLSSELCEFSCLDPGGILDSSMKEVNALHYKDGMHRVPNDKLIDVPNTDIYTNPPPGMSKCLIDIVSETSPVTHFITEKTVWPIVHQMPFLIHGAWQINQQLKTLGFELFDELIDYSFDDIESPRQRTVAIAAEIERLANLELDYTETYKMLKPKLEHNLCRLIDLYHNDEYMPSMIKYASKELVELTNLPDENEDNMSPINGSWLAKQGGRNQTAVDLVNSTPYLLDMYKKWL